MSKKSHLNSTLPNITQLKQQIKELIPFHQEDISEDENLLELGLDSISIMQLVSQWRSQGSNVTCNSLIKQPSLLAWHALLKKRGEVHE